MTALYGQILERDIAAASGQQRHGVARPSFERDGQTQENRRNQQEGAERDRP